ncbi:MAG TPA: hypothetical protein VF498_07990, partial [Anaerolineales bacterium]
RECIEEDAPFGVLLIKSGPETGGTAIPHDVGTTARILQVEYLEDGRMNIFTLKLVFGVLLLLAHQRFIENKGLVVYVLVAFVANLIVSILYGIVPGILVSITDAIAAIIVIIIGIILGIILIIGAIISIVMALKPV